LENCVHSQFNQGKEKEGMKEKSRKLKNEVKKIGRGNENTGTK
jgi:hypothetical protein